jgi:hypothetical protein
MGDFSVKITEVDNISTVPVDITSVPPVEISSIDRVQRIAPVAVHIKELNQVDPLLIESLRVDRVTNIDPVSVDRLNVTRLPVVNLSVNQVPGIAIDVKSIPPVAIALTQALDLTSDYMARGWLLGVEILRVRLTGTTQVTPRDCARREQFHNHEESFTRVVAAGNPAIPSRMEARSVTTAAPLRCGAPRFAYAASRMGG